MLLDSAVVATEVQLGSGLPSSHTKCNLVTTCEVGERGRILPSGDKTLPRRPVQKAMTYLA